MTDTADFHERIAASRRLVSEANSQLALGMMLACQLPHDFVQRRDGHLPWCKTCGYDVTGLRVENYGKAE